ncbi:hypothetical protein B0H10DRAFT_1830584, partial [Mycena sp. CBHHK59/15]
WPKIFRLFADYAPIQATSVPSERVFLSSAETDTKRRNRTSAVLMRLCKCSSLITRNRGSTLCLTGRLSLLPTTMKTGFELWPTHMTKTGMGFGARLLTVATQQMGSYLRKCQRRTTSS